MSDSYNISKWVEGFDNEKGVFDYNYDARLSNSKVLLPGRFYILNYKAQTEKPYNARPVILSLGISKEDPDSFICLDLAVIPYKLRIKFVQKIFDIFKGPILKAMNKFWDSEDADKQKQLQALGYDLIKDNKIFAPFKYAIKKYKIKNTMKIYSLPYSKVYKVIGKFADNNTFVNTTVSEEQREFIKKAQSANKPKIKNEKKK